MSRLLPWHPGQPDDHSLVLYDNFYYRDNGPLIEYEDYHLPGHDYDDNDRGTDSLIDIYQALFGAPYDYNHFDHRADNDDLHRAGYQHVYADYSPNLDHDTGGDEINDKYHDHGPGHFNVSAHDDGLPYDDDEFTDLLDRTVEHHVHHDPDDYVYVDFDGPDDAPAALVHDLFQHDDDLHQHYDQPVNH